MKDITKELSNLINDYIACPLTVYYIITPPICSQVNRKVYSRVVNKVYNTIESLNEAK